MVKKRKGNKNIKDFIPKWEDRSDQKMMAAYWENSIPEIEPHDPKDLCIAFKNVQCTLPANKELAEWCLWMLKHHEYTMRVLQREGQKYVGYGGCGVYDFTRWKKQLKQYCMFILIPKLNKKLPY